MDGVFSYFETARSQTVAIGGREISGEEKLAVRMIRNAWKDYHDKSLKKRQAAVSFINDGLHFWAWVVGLDYDHVVGMIKRFRHVPIQDGRSNGRLNIEWRNESHTLAGWAEKLGIEKNTFRARLNDWGYCEKTFSKRI